MRAARVYINDRLAGVLREVSPSEYTFRYDEAYLQNPSAPAVSLTLPKSRRTFQSDHLFSFFANMLSDGHNRAYQAGAHKLDPDDDFGLLLASAQTDTPGAITLMPIHDDTVH